MTVILNEETGREVDLDAGILSEWMSWHEDTTPADARDMLYEDADGAVICSCCGVNYNPEVDKD